MVWYGMVRRACGMVWYGVVQCGMLWYVVVWYGMWYGVVWYQCGMVWYGMVWCGVVWCGMVWYGMVWYGMVWYGMASCSLTIKYVIMEQIMTGNTQTAVVLTYVWITFSCERPKPSARSSRYIYDTEKNHANESQ